MATTDLADAIRALALALDPHRQGDCWPDPVAWDGRPLAEQARDLLVLADAEIEGADDYQHTAVRDAAAELRTALARTTDGGAVSRYMIGVESGRLSPERVCEDDIESDYMDEVGPVTHASDGLTGFAPGERIVGEWHDDETGALVAVLVERRATGAS